LGRAIGIALTAPENKLAAEAIEDRRTLPKNGVDDRGQASRRGTSSKVRAVGFELPKTDFELCVA
jgi:hypothetical protein